MTPAGERHPDFEAGNEVSTKHGAYSPRKVEPLADEMVASILELAEREPAQLGYLAQPQHRASLWAWARTEARVQLVHEWLIDLDGEVDDFGDVTAASKLLTRLEKQAESLRARLGLDPRSAADLAKSRAGAALVGFDLAAAIAAGRGYVDATAHDHDRGGDAAGITPPDEQEPTP